jgi:Zn finger protein HypA/HybF involved in hydrogenase expression
MMVDRKTVLTNLKNFYEWNFKNYPLNFDEAQVIIEALEQNPVIHGHWTGYREQREDGWNIPHTFCSECKKEYDPYSTKFIKFCPNCGADMREVENENQ